jgi:hypothetical protein
LRGGGVVDQKRQAMGDAPNHPENPRDAARNNRLRDALRENLKRRKMQSRGRASLPEHSVVEAAPSGVDAAPDIGSERTDSDETS